MLYLVLLITLIDSLVTPQIPVENPSLIPMRRSQINEMVEQNTHFVYDIPKTDNAEKTSVVLGSTISLDEMIRLLNNEHPGVWLNTNFVFSNNIYDTTLVMGVIDYFKETHLPRVLRGSILNQLGSFMSYFGHYEYERSWQPDRIEFSYKVYEEIYGIFNTLYEYPYIWDDRFNNVRHNMMLRAFAETPEISDKWLKTRLYDYYNNHFDKWRELQNIMYAVILSHWEDYNAGGNGFIEMFYDDEMINFIMEVNNRGDELWEQDMFFVTQYAVRWYSLAMRFKDYNINELDQFIINKFNTRPYGDYFHYTYFAYMYDAIGSPKSNIFDLRNIREGYYDYIEGDGYVYDDGNFVVKTVLDKDVIDNLYYSYNEVKTGFFNLFGNVEPIDDNMTLTSIIFPDPYMYSMLSWPLYLFDGSNNGGIYFEGRSTFFTFERPDYYRLTLNDLFRHEYVHYLDGLYNIPDVYGATDFYDWDTGRHLWWTEGLAEYISRYNMNVGFGIGLYNLSVINDYYHGRPNLIDSYFTLEWAMSPDWSLEFAFYSFSSLSWYMFVETDINIIRDLAQMIREGRYQDFENEVNRIRTDVTYANQYKELVRKIAEVQNYNDAVTIGLNNYLMYPYNNGNVDLDKLSDLLNKELHITKTIPNTFVGFTDTLTTNNGFMIAHNELISKVSEVKSLSHLFSGFEYTLGQIIQTNGNEYVYEITFPQFGEFNETFNWSKVDTDTTIQILGLSNDVIYELDKYTEYVMYDIELLDSDDNQYIDTLRLINENVIVFNQYAIDNDVYDSDGDFYFDIRFKAIVDDNSNEFLIKLRDLRKYSDHIYFEPITEKIIDIYPYTIPNSKQSDYLAKLVNNTDGDIEIGDFEVMVESHDRFSNIYLDGDKIMFEKDKMTFSDIGGTPVRYTIVGNGYEFTKTQYFYYIHDKSIDERVRTYVNEDTLGYVLQSVNVDMFDTVRTDMNKIEFIIRNISLRSDWVRFDDRFDDYFPEDLVIYLDDLGDDYYKLTVINPTNRVIETVIPLVNSGGEAMRVNEFNLTKDEQILMYPISIGTTVPTNVVDDVIPNFEVSVYPNPTTDYIKINNVNLVDYNTNLTIYGMMGTKVYDTKVQINQTLDIRHLSSGVYIIRIGDKSYKFTKI